MSKSAKAEAAGPRLDLRDAKQGVEDGRHPVQVGDGPIQCGAQIVRPGGMLGGIL